ncbi:hypothetical protein ACFCX4_06795 [Kitasatospora sp. NPDC056327]|uniref:hypothetical protein n=1 Tax=Kitasatospora sp. NPDC056327 TaxID=3345785 RepID=UPI0035DF8147
MIPPETDRPTPERPLHVHQVLGGGPFAEIGKPKVAVRDEARGLVALGGSVGRLSWGGRSVPDWAGHRVGVYGLGDLRCHHVVRSDWPVLDLALHPHLPLLAVGTGSYDGGYFYEGELLLVDLEHGTTVSALADRREVRRVGWSTDGRALELVVAPPDEEADKAPDTHGSAAVVRHDDWRGLPPRSISFRRLKGPRVRAPRRAGGAKRAARDMVAALAAAHGTSWAPRRQVWAVEALDDGRVLAALEGVKLECRLPSGEPQWSVADPDGARELHVAADQESAWVNVPRPARWAPGIGWADLPGDVERLSLADGSTLGSVGAVFPAALTAALDGRLALRDTRDDRPDAATVVLDQEGRRSPGPALGAYDCYSTHFAVRRSPELLFLQGRRKKYWKDKWVVAVDPPAAAGGEPTVRRLFPLAWDAVRSGHLSTGPAVRLTGDGDTAGALIHTGTIHHPHGRRPDDVFVARRRFPDGLVQWVFTADAPVTAVDTDGETVFAALTSGEVVALDAADGGVRRRTRLTVGGAPTVALSLTAPAPGRLVIGTVDGRVLLCRVPPVR